MSEMDTPKRLSISEETLRLQLSELELRLRIFFQEQLAQKASAADVRLGESRLNALERGDFTPAFKRSVSQVIEDNAKVSTTSSWTRRERIVMIIGICLTFFTCAVNIYVAGHTGSANPPAVQGSK